MNKGKDSSQDRHMRAKSSRRTALIICAAVFAISACLFAEYLSNKEKYVAPVTPNVLDEEEPLAPLEQLLPISPVPSLSNDVFIHSVDFAPINAVDEAVPLPISQPGGFSQDIISVESLRPSVYLDSVFGYHRVKGMHSILLNGNMGNAKTEAAVVRALRWLKCQQMSDGSWPSNKVAMTGLALIAFLAHGEKPGGGNYPAEFDKTVIKAIEFLIGQQDSNGLYSLSGKGYAHAIATCAMCEAYAATLNPNVQKSADKAIEVILKGQNPTGGWDYDFIQSGRNVTPLMGWCAQAIHDAQTAKFYHDREALDRASHLCVNGFKKNGYEEGGFGFTGPGKGGLTGVGVFGMQMHNAAQDSYVTNSLKNVLYAWRPEWCGYTPVYAAAGIKIENTKEMADNIVKDRCPQYYNYYATRAIYYDSKMWKKWMDRMWPSYVDAQFKVAKGKSGSTCTCGLPNCKQLTTPYKDACGREQEIGHWVNTDAYSDRPVMDTCLAVIQLSFFYLDREIYRHVPVSTEMSGDFSDDSDIEVSTEL